MKEFLDYASKKYYEGSPIITDEEFDRLAEEYDYNSVGYVLDDSKVPHPFPLQSLRKLYKGESDPYAEFSGEVVVTPKLDGAAISLVYNGGGLISAATRGDGRFGKDIFPHTLYISGIPQKIKDKNFLQITGEVVASKEVENSRNVAAGSLNLKNPNELVNRNLDFLAYQVTPSPVSSYRASLEYLETQGFITVLAANLTDYYLTDGEVWRIDDINAYKALGATSHHPRGAFALKERKEGIVTTLLDVVWQLGKSGVVSPVAILEPIKIGDATVSRATLHNMKYIDDLGLEIGCQVEVVRSGEIIPRVMRRV